MIFVWLKFKDYGGDFERNCLEIRLCFRESSVGMFFLKIKVFSSFVLIQVTLSRLGTVKSDGVKIKRRWGELGESPVKHTWKLSKWLGLQEAEATGVGFCLFMKLSKTFRTCDNNQNLTSSVCLSLRSYWVCVPCKVECCALCKRNDALILSFWLFPSFYLIMTIFTSHYFYR